VSGTCNPGLPDVGVLEVDELAFEVGERAADVLGEPPVFEWPLQPVVARATTLRKVAQRPLLLSHGPGGRTGDLVVTARTLLAESVQRSLEL
jgi:hypothetical protein